jgi:HlyD family secretion protein
LAIAQDAETSRAIYALGRFEPQHGVIRVGAPSTPQALSGSIVLELPVRVGEDVAAGQLLAVLETAPVLQAALNEVKSELDLAQRDAEASRSKGDEACVRADVADRDARRLASLFQQGLAAEEETEQAQGDAEALAASCVAARAAVRVAEARVSVVRAQLARKTLELDRAYIRAPTDGRVLEIVSHPGELVGLDGILELGRVDRMYAIAEVYETDIRNVRVGQRATVSSKALDTDLSGTVELIRPKIQKHDEIGTDPAARKDARIVEVEIRLDEPSAAAALTNLQVDVVIGP